MRDISKAFGIAISDARRKRGLRQVDLAEELDFLKNKSLYL